MTAEAAAAKRREIAASIRTDATQLADPTKPLPEFYRLAESLCYEKDEATFTKVQQMAAQYVAGLKAIPADKLAAMKDEARHFGDVFRYLARWRIIGLGFAPKADLDQIIQGQRWDRKT